jgi:NTE family protein
VIHLSSSKRIGLALSGGAALGAAHIGVLEVLEENGIRPYCVAGTSAGSAVGVVYCAGMSLERIKELAMDLEWGKLGRVVLPRRGFFDGSRLEEYLIELIGDLTFEELTIPFAATAADILRDELIILSEGRVAPAVRASCALPGVFTPVEYGGRLLVDGGVINNLPVSAVREMGAEYVIAVDLSSPPAADRKPPTTLLEMWFLSVATLIRNTHREASLADLVIRPDVGEFSWIDLPNVPTFIGRGRQATEEMIPRILHDLNMEGSVAG